MLLASSVSERGFPPAERNFVFTFLSKEAKSPEEPVFLPPSPSLRLQPFSAWHRSESFDALRAANGNKQVAAQINDKIYARLLIDFRAGLSCLE